MTCMKHKQKNPFCKDCRDSSPIGNVVTGAIGAGIGLGVGANVLGSMGQGAMAGQIITPAANMMGPMITVGMGMGILDMVNTQTKKLQSDKNSKNLSLRDFIKLNKTEIDAAIHSVNPDYRINDEERRQWVMNSEGLYKWAKRSGVRL